MRNIQEYSIETSPHELLGHLSDRMIAGELLTFEALRAYTDRLPDTPAVKAVLKRAFELQRRLDWGFFQALSPEAYPGLWSELVVQDRRYPFAGDLKRRISISEIYLGLIDIHGYTEFCRKCRNNVSVLERLDTLLQEELPKIAATSGVLSRRARGDEILLLGARASDVLEAVLGIMGRLSGKGAAASSAALPRFAISAGVAGGQKYTPLVITRDGDLSGDIVNTAARLQARAGKICPDRDKILVAGPVYQKLVADRGEALAGLGLDFVSSGKVEFKGATFNVYDAVFLPAERYRLSYCDALEALYEDLGKELWSSKILEDALNLAARVAAEHPALATGASARHSCQEYIERAKRARGLLNSERYEQAVAELDDLVVDLSSEEGMDGLALEYLREVAKSYRLLASRFSERLDEEMEEHLDTVFGQKDRENFVALSRNHGMFERVREAARMSIKGRRAIWQRAAETSAPDLAFSLQSLK